MSRYLHFAAAMLLLTRGARGVVGSSTIDLIAAGTTVASNHDLLLPLPSKGDRSEEIRQRALQR